MPVLASARALRRTATKAFRGSALQWHLKNLRSEVSFRMTPRALAPHQARLVASLKRDGIVVTSAEELVGSGTIDALTREVEVLKTACASQIAEVRSGHGRGNKAHYRLNYLGATPTFDASSALARFALSPAIRSLANAYFGLVAPLRYYNVWHTFPTTTPAGDSQLWHRDQEDRFIFKAFYYLDDVTSDTGPLSYIPGSHRRGHRRVAPEAFREPGHGNLRSRDDQMERVVPRARWIEACGPRGTLVLVDTGGFHKGGFSRTQERLVYTCMFTSPASSVGPLFDRDPEASR